MICLFHRRCQKGFEAAKENDRGKRSCFSFPCEEVCSLSGKEALQRGTLVVKSTGTAPGLGKVKRYLTNLLFFLKFNN